MMSNKLQRCLFYRILIAQNSRLLSPEAKCNLGVHLTCNKTYRDFIHRQAGRNYQFPVERGDSSAFVPPFAIE